VQLLDTHDGRPLWGRKVTTSFDDVFEMQDEVSRQIAQALEVELTERDQSRLGRGARAEGTAYELYLKGRLHMLRETVENMNAAVDCFERARIAAPGFAPAWAGFADAYARIAFTFDPEGGWYQRAERVARTALELDPNLPEARYVRGRLLWSPDGGFKHTEAIMEFAAALGARPGLNEAHHWLGIVLFHVSLLDEAAAHFNRALEINPQDDVAFMHLGFCRYLQGAFNPPSTSRTRRDEGIRRPGASIRWRWPRFKWVVARTPSVRSRSRAGGFPATSCSIRCAG
jgi:tetratricopeptide (TPR) repeat protein